MFQRMMVIPQEEYMQLTAIQQARQPLMRQFRNLESQYEEQDHIGDPYRKLMHQSETLDAMKTLKDKMRQEVTTATPKPYQTRARNLFQHLESVLQFNERGEIYDDENQVISESRIEDLIQYAVRDRRRNFLPTGWNQFLKTLRSHNIPKYMLNRNTLDEMDSVKQQPKVEKKFEVKSQPIKKEPVEPSRKRKFKQEEGEPKLRPARKRRRPAKYSVDFLSNF